MSCGILSAILFTLSSRVWASDLAWSTGSSTPLKSSIVPWMRLCTASMALGCPLKVLAKTRRRRPSSSKGCKCLERLSVCEEKVSLNVRAVSLISFRLVRCPVHMASQAAFWLAVFSLSLPVFSLADSSPSPACFWEEESFLSFSEGVPLEAESASGFGVASILAAARALSFAASAFFAVEEGLAFSFAGPAPGGSFVSADARLAGASAAGQSTASVARKIKTRMENIAREWEPGRMSMAFTNKKPAGAG